MAKMLSKQEWAQSSIEEPRRGLLTQHCSLSVEIGLAVIGCVRDKTTARRPSGRRGVEFETESKQSKQSRQSSSSSGG